MQCDHRSGSIRDLWWRPCRVSRPSRDLVPAASAFASAYSLSGPGTTISQCLRRPGDWSPTGLNTPVLHTLHLPPDAAIAAALSGSRGQSASRKLACVSCSGKHLARSPSHAILTAMCPCSVPWSDTAEDGHRTRKHSAPKGCRAIDIAQGPGVRIDVYGDIYDAEYAREQIDPRRDAPGVTVHEGVPRTSMWAAMARAAVVVCPARWDEPFGIAAADAQACGTPVVAFKRGGLGEIIVDGVTGPGLPMTSNAADSVGGRQSRAAFRRHEDLTWNGSGCSTAPSGGHPSAGGPRPPDDRGTGFAVAMVTRAPPKSEPPPPGPWRARRVFLAERDREASLASPAAWPSR
jgi:hypothetical protein